MPGGVLGVAGGIALMLGGIVVIAGLGGGAALAIPVGIGLGVMAGGGALYVGGKGQAGGAYADRAGAEGALRPGRRRPVAGQSPAGRSSWTARCGAPGTHWPLRRWRPA